MGDVELSNYEKMAIVEDLIKSGNGDTGRLTFILECLKNQKPLFKSDKMYLENKISSYAIVTKPTQCIESNLLSSITKLLELHIGEPGRLHHIYDAIDNGKQLFNSDRQYLEEKLKTLHTMKEHDRIDTVTDLVDSDDVERVEKLSVGVDNKQIKNLTQMLLHANDKIQRLEDVIFKKQEQMKAPPPLQSEIKLRGTMPKNWTPTTQISEQPELSGLYENIKSESEKLDSQKQLQETLKIQQSKLTQIILNRQEYEKQVEIEQKRIEEQIQQENERIEEQTRLIDEITQSKKELDEAKKDRERISSALKKEKETIEEQIQNQKQELEKIRNEFKIVEKNSEQQKSLLTDQIRKEKEKLSQHDAIMKAILDQNEFLEQIKKERENLTKQIQLEREKLNQVMGNTELIKSHDVSLEKIRKEKEELLSLLEHEKLELQNIVKEKEKIQKEISTKLEHIEQTKHKEKETLMQLILNQQNISKEIIIEKEKLSEQALRARELKAKQEELEKTRNQRSALERQLKEAKAELALIKRQSKKVAKQIDLKNTKLNSEK